MGRTGKAPLAVLLALVAISSGCTHASVPGGEPTLERVVDGDTVEVESHSGVRTVRLVGIDSPELHEVSPHEFDMEVEAGECLRERAREARERLSLYEGRIVELEADFHQGRTGDYGRKLAYVSLEEMNRSLNYLMVREGLARVYASRFSRYNSFRRAEERARDEGKGLWSCGG